MYRTQVQHPVQHLCDGRRVVQMPQLARFGRADHSSALDLGPGRGRVADLRAPAVRVRLAENEAEHRHGTLDVHRHRTQIDTGLHLDIDQPADGVLVAETGKRRLISGIRVPSERQ